MCFPLQLVFRDDCSTALVAACALIDGFESTDPVEEEGARERDRKQKKNEWKNRNGRRRRRRRRRERQKKKKKNERETTRF